MSIAWPKIPKLDDVVKAIDALDERVAANTARIDTIIATQQARIAELEHFADEHRAGAAERQREIDTVKAEQARQAWAARFRRR